MKATTTLRRRMALRPPEDTQHLPVLTDVVEKADPVLRLAWAGERVPVLTETVEETDPSDARRTE